MKAFKQKNVRNCFFYVKNEEVNKIKYFVSLIVDPESREKIHDSNFSNFDH
jgi:hypothetical protein